MGRKVLYSPGFGAGWVSWHRGTREEQLFMLEYKPFIAAIEDEEEFTKESLDVNKSAIDHMLKSLVGLTLSKYDHNELRERNPGVYMVLPEFIEAYVDRFGKENFPYLGGLYTLAVYEASEGALVRVEDYDGNESVEEFGSCAGYL
jgi:hypothetical protein